MTTLKEIRAKKAKLKQAYAEKERLWDEYLASQKVTYAAKQASEQASNAYGRLYDELEAMGKNWATDLDEDTTPLIPGTEKP